MRKWLLLFGMFTMLQSTAQFNATPLVKGFGQVLEVPSVDYGIDPKLSYKLVIDVMQSPNPDSVNEGLLNGARIINLHAAAGVTPKKLSVVFVLHNVAAFTLTSNEAYRKKYGKDNPNIALIKAIQDAGARVTICGQTMQKRGIAREALLPNVQVGISALTTISTLQQQGYTILKSPSQ
jgi:intracellular sulfur oxidation DsrE/DsrF family protein